MSIEESISLYRGLNSAKQYIKEKPVKFVYKLWKLSSSDGYSYNFEYYCGKNERRTKPLRAHVVETMLSCRLLPTMTNILTSLTIFSPAINYLLFC